MQNPMATDRIETWRPYRELQNFGLWLYPFLTTGLCYAIYMSLTPVTNKTIVSPLSVGLILVVGYALSLDFLWLRTSVNIDVLTVCLGWPVPMAWKHIVLKEIVATSVITYRPLRDAGGWGLRFGRFEGKFTTYWTARGSRGVLVETDRRCYVIGSQGPEALHAAIENARGQVNYT